MSTCLGARVSWGKRLVGIPGISTVTGNVATTLFFENLFLLLDLWNLAKSRFEKTPPQLIITVKIRHCLWFIYWNMCGIKMDICIVWSLVAPCFFTPLGWYFNFFPLGGFIRYHYCWIAERYTIWPYKFAEIGTLSLVKPRASYQNQWCHLAGI
jgi:hypothetical protein